MTAALIVRQAGPAMTVQDLGRPGYLAKGISAGGAADRTALIEGAALLGHDASCAALEMAGMGGTFEATGDIAIALTGAPMRAQINGQAVVWNASHLLQAGEVLTISGASSGVYGYLHVGGGFDAPAFLGSRATHLATGIGTLVQAGDRLVAKGQGTVGQLLPVENRFAGGTVRVLPSVQTAKFADHMIARFSDTTFTRGARGNRQGVALDFDGEAFALDDQLTVLSEPMLAGDIQMTGEGRPYVLLAECQTTGGYPRIATVLPNDLPIIAQSPLGAAIRFEFVDYDAAVAAHMTPAQQLAALKKQLRPLVRDPHMMTDLLSYQLISGVTTGRD